MGNRKFVQQELEIIERHYPYGGAAETQQALIKNGFFRTIGTIRAKANMMNVKFNHNKSAVLLTGYHRRIIMDNYTRHGVKAIIEHFHRMSLPVPCADTIIAFFHSQFEYKKAS